MAILLKNETEIRKIRESGRYVAEILSELRLACRPGVTTKELDELAVKLLKERGGKSGSLGYHGYPGSICTSVNEEVVHGIPGPRVLRDGDCVTVDLAASFKGWFADSAITVPVGKVAADVERLLKVTEDAMYRGIAAARARNRLSHISRAVQETIEAAGYSLVKHYGGHGIGRSMHEDPHVMNYVERGVHDPVLKPGMVITIEPMVIMGQEASGELADGWTVVSLDGSPSAHFEHTIAITNGDAQILTQL